LSGIFTQRAETWAVVRGLRTSPTDVLCAHAHILPALLELDKHTHRAALQLAMLPHMHPLIKIYKKVTKRKVKQHKAPIHHLAQIFQLEHVKFETILTAEQNPAQIRNKPFQIDIPRSKEDLRAKDEYAPENIKVYLDSSSHRGKVGAATILMQNDKVCSLLHFHLGKAEEHTVFEAKW
jgi:hypothetical protein